LCYLDSGCSRYMSGDKGQFKKFEFTNGNSMTFGDRSITTIEGKIKVEIHCLPIFPNVLFVNDLKGNLLSISQFCDENHNVSFLRINTTSTIVLASGS